jgi:putative flippase GtrA
METGDSRPGRIFRNRKHEDFTRDVLSRAAMLLPLPPTRLADRLRQAWGERAVALKAASFAMVGVVNTIVDASVFFLAYAYLTSWLVAANVLAWGAGVTCSYVLNSFITFAHESGRKLSLRAYGTFVASGIVGAIANTTMLVVAAQFIPVWAAKGCAILVSFLVNFSMSNFVVFRRKQIH